MLTLAMSLLLLIDGYNLIAPVAAPSRRPTRDWLHRERNLLLSRLVQKLPPRVRVRCCVVFDAASPPPNVVDQYEFEGIVVRFSVEYPEADDLLEEIIASHSAPKQLCVVSSDHRIQAAAKTRGATTFESQAWLDDLLDGRIGLAPEKRNRAGQGSDSNQKKKPNHIVDQEALGEWMRKFGFDDD
jgi:uncharacterized protein